MRTITVRKVVNKDDGFARLDAVNKRIWPSKCDALNLGHDLKWRGLDCTTGEVFYVKFLNERESLCLTNVAL